MRRLWLIFGLSREPSPAKLVAGPSNARLQTIFSRLCRAGFERPEPTPATALSSTDHPLSPCIIILQPVSTSLIIMASDSNPGTQVSCSNPKCVKTTPINTGSRTLHRFGDKQRDKTRHYISLASEMSPHFVGPMPISNFLSEFLPLNTISLPSFKPGMFEAVVSTKEESEMYEPFVCP